MNGYLIKNALLVDHRKMQRGALLTHGERIERILPLSEYQDPEQEALIPPDTEVIDAQGAMLLPGGVDPHVHMELPVAGTCSCDDFASGTRAALAGGTTTIIDFVTPGRTQPLADAYQERAALAEKSCCDYGLHMSITAWRESLKAEIPACANDLGITSFKTYMAYLDSVGIDNAALRSVLETTGRHNLLVLTHCEDGARVDELRRQFRKEGKTEPIWHARSRPPECEAQAVVQAIDLAHRTRAALYVVHVSTLQGVKAIAEAKQQGDLVFGEACPHHLLLEEEHYLHSFPEAAGYVLSPPLRSSEHCDALWQGLENNTLDVVATDHCPFNQAQKARGKDDFTLIPNGAAGVEERLALLLEWGVLKGRISAPRFVALTAANPARLFGLWPRKGCLRPGADADLVLWSTSSPRILAAETQLSTCDFSIYEGIELRVKPDLVFLRGRPVLQDGQLLADAGAGRYLRRGVGGLDKEPGAG